MDYSILFPNLNITLEHVIKSVTIGNLTIAMYGIVIAAGMVLGTLAARAEARRTRQDPDDYLTFAIIAIIVGVIGARIYYVVFSWDKYKDDLLSIFNIRQGGLAIYGGIIGAIIVALIFCKVKKIHLGTLLDTAVLGLLIGQIIGRWGNFFNREAFGEYTDGPFAMLLPLSAVRTSDVTELQMAHVQIVDGVSYISVHPTFLYESLWNLMVLIVILFLRKKKRFPGEVFCMYLVGYGAGRVWLEALRTDQLLLGNTQIPISQVVSAVMIAAGVVLIIVGRLYAHRHPFAGISASAEPVPEEAGTPDEADPAVQPAGQDAGSQQDSGDDVASQKDTGTQATSQDTGGSKEMKTEVDKGE